MTHKARPPHEDPAFLRPKVTEFYEQNGDVVMREESGMIVIFRPGQRIQLGSCRPVIDVVDVDAVSLDRRYIRVQLLGLARSCWDSFFVDASNSNFPIPWDFVDAAREFERRAAEIAP